MPQSWRLVLLHNARWDAPALADRDTPVFRPRADIRAALTARCGTHRPASLASSSLAGMFDVGRDLPAERAGILLIEIDLVVRAAQPEPQRLVCWASIKVVFEFDSDLCAILDCMLAMGYPHRTRSNAIL